MKIDELLNIGFKKLKKNNIENCYKNSQILLMHTLNIDLNTLLTSQKNVSLENINKFYNYIEQLITGIPLQYITNKSFFMDFEFFVDDRVLIPRPETEILLELIIKYINKKNFKNFLEIGTGSGCIPISICKYCENINGFATDISEKALEVAKINAKNLNVINKINFLKSNLFDKIKNLNVDIIISNPPYINKEDFLNLPKNVFQFEPKNALYGGKDGLLFYKKIISNSKHILNNNGMIFFEIGYNQGSKIKNLMIENGFKNIHIVNDYNNLNRVVFGTYER